MNQPTIDNAEAAIDALPESVASLCEKLLQTEVVKPHEICQMIKEADITVIDLMPWADLDHSPADSYGRKMVFEGPNFEVMVMSWKAGDFSAIHDHGYTQWGAVKVFGEAEHATFRVEDDKIHTLSRTKLKPGTVVGVGHSLIHQMGNSSSNEGYISLHVYGDLVQRENVTADARLYDLESGKVQRVNGGVFFALPENEIDAFEDGPMGDFPTRLRHHIELVRRLRRIKHGGLSIDENRLFELIEEIYCGQQLNELISFLDEMFDEEYHVTDSSQWNILRRELIEAAALQNELNSAGNSDDAFKGYAELYDEIVGKPSLHRFMQKYLTFFKDQFANDLEGKSIISLGCGTGLVEEYMIKRYGLTSDQVYGIDVSEGMILEARKRIQADCGNILTLDPDIRIWDIAYSGLNVFHYLPAERLEEAIQKTANIIKTGGFFLGDFITPDHIRWYPNFIQSESEKIISLREPRLIEDKGKVYQESEIINIKFTTEDMFVNYAGKHRRYLPPIHRVRNYFINAFGPEVYLYDAVSLQPITEDADSCASTRYIVIAVKS
jgi:SAM-dependent methyltransferase